MITTMITIITTYHQFADLQQHMDQIFFNKVFDIIVKLNLQQLRRVVH